jgi:seryl-tRNA synthetase
MFISKEKFDALQTAHDNLVAERKQITEALALKPEATTEDILTSISKAGEEAVNAANQKATEAESKFNNTKDAITKVNTSLDELGASVKEAVTTEAKIEAVRTLLAAKPGASQTTTTAKDTNPKDGGVDQETIDNLPHNREYDANQAK